MEKQFRKIVSRTGLEGSRLLLGVSGGIDSMVLLELLATVAPQFELQLQVLHLDHCIRAGSDADAGFVQRVCDRLGVPCVVERIDVPLQAKHRRLSLETAGRELRRELLQRLAEEKGCRRIVLGHHRDDQVETFLQRLLRGSGLSGLQAMREDDGLYWRPLLSFSRAQIEAHVRKRGLEWVEDTSNTDPRFLRNRLRHQLLPQLRDINPRLDERLAGLSRQLQREEDFWQQQIETVWPQLAPQEEDGLRLKVEPLLSAHPALQMRLLREGLRRVRGDLRGVEAVHLEALRQLLTSGSPQAEIDLPGCWAGRRYACIWLRREQPQEATFAFELAPGQMVELPDGRLLELKLCDAAQGEGEDRVEFNPAHLHFPLLVRSPRPGDRFVPSGMTGRRKVKDFLIDRKLEKELRRSLPLLCSAEEILWLVGLRRSSLAPAASGDRKVLVARLLERS